MSTTYLQFCQKMIRDLGMSNTISTVVSQTGMNQKIVDWIADADEFVQSIWFDWDFLWTQASVNTIAGTRQYTKESDFGTYDLDSFYLDYTSDSYVHLNHMGYKEFMHSYRNGTQTNAEPDSFVITPGNNIYLHPIPDAVYSMSYDYWKTPTRMTVDASTSAIPARFERIIIAKAKIYYAEHEEFMTVMQSATNEYVDLLNKLEAASGPMKNRSRKKMYNQDMPLVEQWHG